jgi:flagellar hook-associated protein 2
MSGIQSAVGLVTGIPIQQTVDQLIAYSARSRDLLASRVSKLGNQQVAVKELTAVIASLELSISKFGEDATYNSRQISSTHPDLLSFVKTGTPTFGSYQFTPIKKASTHQLLSERFGSSTTPIGAGSLSFQFGGHLNDSVALDQLNGGNGIQRGQIRITDRSGASATVDLRYAFSIDDVLEAINNSTSINVTASTKGDQIVLTDNTGQSTSNLIVAQVGSNTTAADLGLANINVASAVATGTDIISLGDDTFLSTLNNKTGVGIRKGVSDFSITFGDASTLEVDLENEATISDILNTLNAVDPARLEARISTDGDRIELVDLTGASAATFEVQSVNGSTAARDLGFEKTALAGTPSIISGDRVQAGLKTTLLSRLAGGSGISTLGTIDITDRLGNSATVDLSTAETVDDVIDLLNSAGGIQISASINGSRNGIQISDSSGGAGPLTIANSGDGSASADLLKIAGSVAGNQIVGGALDLQIVGSSTLLSKLNYGEGIDNGSFLITDSNGVAAAINFKVSKPETVGDLLDEINSLGIGVSARINDSGTGVILEDTAGGTQSLTVNDVGNSTTAADLRIAGVAEGGVLNGSYRTSIDIDDDDTLDDLIAKINEATGGATATKIFDGTGYRLALNSSISGKVGELLLDSIASGINFQETSSAEDALLVYGTVSDDSLGVLVSSNDNEFEQVVEGLTLNVGTASTQAVTITVGEDHKPIIENVKKFVEQFNAIIDKIQTLRSFESNESEDDVQIKTGILFGSSELLRVENVLNNLVTERVFFAGSFQSLAELGISYDGDTGKLKFEEDVLNEALAADYDAVVDFLRTETHGLTDRFQTAIDKLSGEEGSVLTNRSATLQRKIDSLNERIERKDESLEKERARLLNQFYALESTIQKLQASQTALGSIKPLSPIRISRS